MNDETKKVLETLLARSKGKQLEFRSSPTGNWIKSTETRLNLIVDCMLNDCYEYRVISVAHKWENLVEFIRAYQTEDRWGIRFGKPATELRELQEYLFTQGFRWAGGEAEYCPSYHTQEMLAAWNRTLWQGAESTQKYFYYNSDTCKFEETSLVICHIVAGGGTTYCDHREAHLPSRNCKSHGCVAYIEAPKPTYYALQTKWALEHSIDRGSTVLVTTKTEESRCAIWTESMGACLGKLGEVRHMSSSGVTVAFEGISYTFDFAALMPVKVLKGYKVLYVCNTDSFSTPPRYTSVCVTTLGSNKVEYALDKWTEPKPNCGPLCVFKSEESARKFFDSEMRSMDGIAECEYIPSNSERIWAGNFDNGKNLSWLPSGTALASAVRLTRRIQ